MATEIVLPKTGMGIEEGTVAQWLKAEGEIVKQGEPVVEIESAKALEQVEAPVSGRLTKILRAQGETVAVNKALGLIQEEK